MHKMRNPMVRLRKALYGHKNSGAYWAECCDVKVKRCGFEPVGQAWPSVYANSDTGMLLIVYVDDMKCSGPKARMAETWKELGKHFDLDIPKGNAEGEHTFLGCVHRKKTWKETVNGVTKEFTGMEYDVMAYPGTRSLWPESMLARFGVPLGRQ